MSTATMRLRRAGAGGLAAAVIAGMLVASAGAASAAIGFTADSSTTVYPGLNSQAAGDLTQVFANSWATNASETFTVASNFAATDCSTTAGIAAAIGFAAAPTFTLSGPTDSTGTVAGNTLDTKPTVTVALGSSNAACATAGVKDQVTVTFGLPSTGTAGDLWTFAVSGIKYNVGASAPIDAVNVTAANGTTAGWGSLGTVTNATVANTKFTAASIVATTPAATGVALGALTAADVGAAHITSPITYTLSGTAVFTAGVTPTMVGPAGSTWTFTGAGTNTLVATAAAAVPTTSANTYVLSGVKIDPTGTAGAIKVTASYGAAVTIGSAQVVASSVNQTRNGGTDRYATAANLFVAGGFGGTAVLASGANFPDALSANFLARQLGTGTLLTDPAALPSITLNTIVTRGVSTVYIVGGTGAVSAAVANQIAATHVANQPNQAFINVVRIAGADRYQTNLAVNEYQFATHTTAIVATGANFADALAVGPAVVHAQYPLILTTGTALSASAAQQLTDMGVTNVVIVGGTGAVSTAVETAIKGMGITITARLSGTDRTQTAAAIATWETTSVANGGLGMAQATVHIANGANFPDALAAGPVAGSGAGAVILLSLSPTTLGAGAPTYLAGLTGTVTTLNALGLTGAVSPAVMNAAAVALAG